MHQVRHVATSVLGSREVLPAERADFLKLPSPRPAHRSGRAARRAAGSAAAAPGAPRRKGQVRRPCVPPPFPNGKEEEQADEALSLSSSAGQSSSQRHFRYLIILAQVYT